jgi:hypothetical protein
MPDEKAPQFGAFLPASLMYFCSGETMHFYVALTPGPTLHHRRAHENARTSDASAGIGVEHKSSGPVGV